MTARDRIALGLVLFLSSALVAAGCGGGGGGESTPTPTPTPTGTPSPLPTGTLTVRVHDFRTGAPIAGAVIVHHAPDGSVLGDQTTAVNGTATVTITAGDMITAAYLDAYGELETIMAVEPGDQLVFGIPVALTGTAGHFDVTFPGGYPGAKRYAARTDCNSSRQLTVVTPGDPAPDATLSAFQRCASREPNFQFLGLALDTSFRAVAFSTSTQTLAGGPGVTLPAWSNAFVDVTATLSNPPAGATSLAFGADFRRDGSRFSLSNSQSVAVAATSAVARIPPFTSVDVGALVPGVRMAFALGGGGSATVSLTRVDPALSVTPAFDLSMLLPHFETAGVDLVDPARPAFTWTVSGDLSGADYVRALQQWYSPGVDRDYFWEVLAPASTTLPLTFPALPDSLAAFRPPATGSYGNVQFVETTELSGYDQARRDIKALIVGTSDAASVSRNSSFSFSN